MAETTFIATSSAFVFSATSVSPSAPAGTQDDDLMIAIVCGLQSPSSTPPSGWTLLAAGGAYFRSFYKIASSEAGTYTFTQGAAGKMRAQIATYRGGFDIADPIDAISNTQYTVIDTELRADSFTVSSDNENIIFLGGSYNTGSVQTFTPPTNPGTFTEDVDDGESTSDISVEFAHYLWPSSGVTGNISAVISSSSNSKHAFAVSLNSAILISNSLMLSMGF